MTARLGLLRFAAAPLRDGTEPAGALVDELLRTPADLWPHVERLGAAWQNAAFVLGFAPLTAADCTAANADEPPD